MPPVLVDCAPYACVAAACLASCVGDADCAPGFVCLGAACVVPGSDAGVPDGAAGAGGGGGAPTDGGVDASAEAGPAGAAGAGGGAGATGTAGGGAAAGTGGTAVIDGGFAEAGTKRVSRAKDEDGCGCRAPGSPPGHAGALAMLGALVALCRRYTRRSP